MDKGYYLISVLLGLILTVNKLDTMFNSYEEKDGDGDEEV